jgi:hypothetical protein
MKTPSLDYRCPLGRHQAQAMDVDAVKQSGWREQRILVVSVTDARLDFIEREFVRRIGERLYGDCRRG